MIDALRSHHVAAHHHWLDDTGFGGGGGAAEFDPPIIPPSTPPIVPPGTPPTTPPVAVDVPRSGGVSSSLIMFTCFEWILAPAAFRPRSSALWASHEPPYRGRRWRRGCGRRRRAPALSKAASSATRESQKTVHNHQCDETQPATIGRDDHRPSSALSSSFHPGVDSTKLIEHVSYPPPGAVKRLLARAEPGRVTGCGSGITGTCGPLQRFHATTSGAAIPKLE